MNTRSITRLTALSILGLAGAVALAARPANAESHASSDSVAITTNAGAHDAASNKPADAVQTQLVDLSGDVKTIELASPAGQADGLDGLDALWQDFDFIASCRDWVRYAVPLSAGTNISVRIEGSALPGSGLDPTLTMYDQNGGFEAFDDDSGGGTSSYMARYILRGQTFYFTVRAYNNASSGAYRATFQTW